MFKCGEYIFKSGDIVDFKDFIVPCNEIVTVTLTEHDSLFNDGHTVLIPCRPNSQQTVDLIVPKGEFSSNVDKIQNINDAMKIINDQEKSSSSRPSANFNQKIKSFGLNWLRGDEYYDREALYNIKVEVITNSFQVDDRVRTDQCGASVINFSGSSNYEYENDESAPFQVELKNLVNQFGVSGFSDKDEFELYIYSDHLRKSIRIPDFDVTDDELVQFSNIYIPCGQEVLISMVKKQTIGEVTIHNTQRIMCNPAAIGYTRKEFRFHNMDVEQRNTPQEATAAMDVVTEM